MVTDLQVEAMADLAAEATRVYTSVQNSTKLDGDWNIRGVEVQV